MLTTLAIANYRSLRDLVVPLGQLNVIIGANGSGKSNLYRALRLLSETAQSGIVPALAREGGLDSALWAGPEDITSRMQRGEVPVQGGPRREPIGLRLGFAGEDLGYAIDLGIPQPSRSAFARDPEIKCEAIWSGPFLRNANMLIDRRGNLARVTDGRSWNVLSQQLNVFETLFAQIADPQRAPEVISLREMIRGWRFYDHFRSDIDAPSRLPQLGTRTPVLSHDGRDLAAAWQTIQEIGDAASLRESVEDAFPGASVNVAVNDGRFILHFSQTGLLRSLSAAELSDGTLRYLLWIAALHTPRPPELMVLNEPETSLHPDLLPALGRLIAKTAARAQVWVVSHAPRLIAVLEESRFCQIISLQKQWSQSIVQGQGMLDKPAWHWPAR